MRRAFNTPEDMMDSVKRSLARKHKEDVIFKGWRHIRYWLGQATVTDWVFVDIDKSICKCEIRPDSQVLGKVIIKVVEEMLPLHVDQTEKSHLNKQYRIDFIPELKDGMLFV